MKADLLVQFGLDAITAAGVESQNPSDPPVHTRRPDYTVPARTALTVSA
jgi:hypothetical protein